MRIRFLAGLYILLFAAIVFCADHPNFQYLFSLVRAVPGGDKFGHFILIGMLAGLLNFSLSCRKVKVAGIRFLLGSMIVFSIVTLEEFSQLYIPSRSFDLIDLTADYVGIVVFGRAAWLLWSRRKQEVTEEMSA